MPAKIYVCPNLFVDVYLGDESPLRRRLSDASCGLQSDNLCQPELSVFGGGPPRALPLAQRHHAFRRRRDCDGHDDWTSRRVRDCGARERCELAALPRGRPPATSASRRLDSVHIQRASCTPVLSQPFDQPYGLERRKMLGPRDDDEAALTGASQQALKSPETSRYPHQL